MLLKANEHSPEEIIRIIRECSEMTQKEFGRCINKSERTIQDYEAGRRCYNAKTLLEVCSKCGLTITIENEKKA